MACDPMAPTSRLTPMATPWYGQSAGWTAEARLLMTMTGLWSLLGLLMLGSASWWMAQREMGDALYYVKRQGFWLLVGWILVFVVVRLPLRHWLRLAPMAVLGCVGLLLLTLTFGTTINGATRWLLVGPVQFQASEVVKPFIVLQGAAIFANWTNRPVDQRLFWIGIFTVVIALVLKQPSLSTAALIGMLLWLMALASGLPLHWLVTTAGLGLAAGTMSILTNSYQWQRVTGFLDPWADPTGNGYQLIQSILAIGSGKLSGSGFALSTQKLQHLPFQTTDFIFSVYAEELGFIGSVFLLGYLVIFAFFGFRVARACRTGESCLVAIGATTLLVGQAILNVAVATGAMPTTGLPFPLLSYGGSSLLSSLVAAGLLIRADLERLNPATDGRRGADQAPSTSAARGTRP